MVPCTNTNATPAADTTTLLGPSATTVMTIEELQAKVHELRELRRMAEELQAEIDSITDALKAAMLNQGTDILNGPDFKITWKVVNSHRLDTKGLTAELTQTDPQLLERFTVSTSSRRFVLN